MLRVIRRDLVVYFDVHRKVHLPLLSHRERIKTGLYCAIFELPLSYPRVTLRLPLSYLRATFELCVLRGLIYNEEDKRVLDL